MSIKNRFCQYIRYKGITQRAFFLRCGISPGYMDRLKRHIGDKKAEAIRAEYPDLNIEWLETGYGKMLNTAGEDSMPDEEGGADSNSHGEIISLRVENAALRERLAEQKELNMRLLEIIDNFKKS